MQNNGKGVLRRYLIRDGSIRLVYQFIFTIVGVAIIFFDVKMWNTGWAYLVGLVFAGVGGISGRAVALRIKPFEDAPYPSEWFEQRRKRIVGKNSRKEDTNRK